MESESTREQSANGAPDGSESRMKEPAVGEDHSGSRHMPEVKRGLLLGIGRWALRHKGEILWGLLFAWVMARFVFPPAHDPYYIRVVERSTNDEATEERLHNLAEQWLIGDVPVKLIVVKLEETDPEKEKEEAKRKAEELANGNDTLMVIGDLTTGVTRQSLPVYMAAKPPVPYISTSASADELCRDCLVRRFLPLLQLSPTNRSEADSMLLWAQEKQKTRCLIVVDGNAAATDYSKELGDDLSKAADDASKKVRIVSTITLGTEKLPSLEDFKAWNPDCVLYAGHADTAGTLWGLIDKWQLVNRSNLLMVFSDGVVAGQHDFGSSYFTYAADAADAADAQNTLYVADAVRIAGALLQDLNRRGGDISFKFRSLLHLENVESARSNIVRIMEENSENRTYYPCFGSSPDHHYCIFSGNQRDNGLFHVWRLNGKMTDVDGWHQPRRSAK